MLSGETKSIFVRLSGLIRKHISCLFSNYVVVHMLPQQAKICDVQKTAVRLITATNKI